MLPGVATADHPAGCLALLLLLFNQLQLVHGMSHANLCKACNEEKVLILTREGVHPIGGIAWHIAGVEFADVAAQHKPSAG